MSRARFPGCLEQKHNRFESRSAAETADCGREGGWEKLCLFRRKEGLQRSGFEFLPKGFFSCGIRVEELGRKDEDRDCERSWRDWILIRIRLD